MSETVSIPKVFISYSWSSADRVVELAHRLVGDGVDVALDKWDLKEGQDKYSFMERSVADDSISKVLMICDKAYAEKANERMGGVGDETMIISSEVYGKSAQEKFIPVICECDDDGKECMPVYLKSRIYIDFTNPETDEENYEKLLRNIYNKPQYSKPALGKMPEWLNEEKVDFSAVRTIVKQLKSLDGKNPAKAEFLMRKFNDEYATALNAFADEVCTGHVEKLLPQIEAMKPLRDLFLDYTDAILIGGLNTADVLGDFFEQVHNATCNTNGRTSCENWDFEFAKFSLWELFICTTAVLLSLEKYRELHLLLNRTYFLKTSLLDPKGLAQTFTGFWHYSDIIEEKIKPQSENPRLYRLSGDIAVKRGLPHGISQNICCCNQNLKHTLRKNIPHGAIHRQPLHPAACCIRSFGQLNFRLTKVPNISYNKHCSAPGPFTMRP
jgi:hypothetical protein